MLSYITLGADDLARAERFYSAVLMALGFVLEVDDEGLAYSYPAPPDRPDASFELYVKHPHDGGLASAGNGTMLAFQAQTQKQVRELHAAALAAGGQDEGAPGFRASYSAGFYVGYLRDPQGNKIALVCNNPDEPRRPG